MDYNIVLNNLSEKIGVSVDEIVNQTELLGRFECGFAIKACILAIVLFWAVTILLFVFCDDEFYLVVSLAATIVVTITNVSIICVAFYSLHCWDASPLVMTVKTLLH